MSDELDTSAPEGDGLSIRDELAAALGASSALDGPSEATPPVSEATAAKPTPEATPAPGTQPRAPDGKFASPSSATPKTEPNAPQALAAPAEGQPAPVQTSGPPSSWSAAAKAEFDKLSPTIQQEVLKREGDIERGKAQWQQGAERLNRLDNLFAPRAERLRMAGITPDQAIGQLLAAQDFLEKDPVNAIAHLARISGVDLRAFGAQAQGQPQQQLHPVIQNLASEIQTLKHAQAQQQRASEQQLSARVDDFVTRFRADPAHPYFDNVEPLMAQLVKAGVPIEEAYAAAVQAHPEVGPIFQRQQEEQRQAQLVEAARAKAAQARHASGSVTGSPAPGATPDRQGPAPTLRDELSAAYAAAAA